MLSKKSVCRFPGKWPWDFRRLCDLDSLRTTLYRTVGNTSRETRMGYQRHCKDAGCDPSEPATLEQFILITTSKCRPMNPYLVLKKERDFKIQEIPEMYAWTEMNTLAASQAAPFSAHRSVTNPDWNVLEATIETALGNSYFRTYSVPSHMGNQDCPLGDGILPCTKPRLHILKYRQLFGSFKARKDLELFKQLYSDQCRIAGVT